MEEYEFDNRLHVWVQCRPKLMLMARIKTRHQHVHGSYSLIGNIPHRSIVEEIVVRKNPIAPITYGAKFMLVSKGGHDGREVSEIAFPNRLCLGW